MNAGPIDKADIRRLIPHAGSMCLLDEVRAWDDTHINCRTMTHRDPAHPLARHGQLSALHLIEYGAQAMAVHGGLRARERNSAALAGMLVSARDVRFEVMRLDDLVAALDILATKLVDGSSGWLYRFEASVEGRRIGEGRVAVIPIPR